ncbi:hypothetical protein OOK12_44785 [Streptomyces sp. NBC_00452]|uniref:hypothetical protein n=1 Tax=Streptomyces sp. NBC_00452 TaxID=2975746 RepID=UPI0022561168|nr:hypothetical protein [Streptomyces sp. NBC_00452]MCX5063951.1 hypothetical protein [Streptomyces sp. NBC_00452]
MTITVLGVRSRALARSRRRRRPCSRAAPPTSCGPPSMSCSAARAGPRKHVRTIVPSDDRHDRAASMIGRRHGLVMRPKVLGGGPSERVADGVTGAHHGGRGTRLVESHPQR